MKASTLTTVETTELELYRSLADLSSEDDLERETDGGLHRVETAGGILHVRYDSPDGDIEGTATLAELREAMGSGKGYVGTAIGRMLGFSDFNTANHARVRTYPSPELLSYAFEATEFLPRIMGRQPPLAYLGMSGFFHHNSREGHASPPQWLEAQRLGVSPGGLPGTSAHDHDLGTIDRHYLRTFMYHESVNHQLQAVLNAYLSRLNERGTYTAELASIVDAVQHTDDTEDLAEHFDGLSPSNFRSNSVLRNLWRYALDQDQLPESLIRQINDACDDQTTALNALQKLAQPNLADVVLLDGLQDTPPNRG